MVYIKRKSASRSTGADRFRYPADICMAGCFIVLMACLAAHLLMLFAGLSLEEGFGLFLIMAAVILAAVFAVLIRIRRQPGHRTDRRTTGIPGRDRQETAQYLYLFFGLLVVLQLAYLMTREQVWTGGNMMLETVNTFLASEYMYQINPMTGSEYLTDVPLRLKVLVLPTLYSFLGRGLSLSGVTVVMQLVPGVVLLLSYLVYWKLSGLLFGGNRRQQGIMLLLVALFYILGGYNRAMDGFGILYTGYLGTTIRSVILIPYAISLCLEKRWKTALLTVVAEACIVWTLYGFGLCFLTVGILYVIDKLRERSVSRCGNS